MSSIKEGHLSLFKAGKIKDKEQFVICKLISPSADERPEIHVYTDGSSKEPSSIVKVKKCAAVGELDQVPKIVKAKYDNYIYICGSGGKPTYLRTDTREQRDEWCAQLQALLSRRATTNTSQAPQPPPANPHRERTQTDSASNRPSISRNPRKGKSPITSPGTMQGIFHNELSQLIKKRVDQTNRPEPIDEVGDSQICCGRHHVVNESSPDDYYEDPSTYQNVHHVHGTSTAEWRQEMQSRQALKRTQELYQDFHDTSNILQEQLEEPENEYEVPEYQRDPLPELSNRLSGCSTASEESEGGVSAMSLAHSLHSSQPKVPTESSWPSSPVPSDDSETEYPGCTPSGLRSTELPGRRLPLPPGSEPEASLCLDESESIYQNTPVFQRRPGGESGRAASLRDKHRPHIPPRKSSLPSERMNPVPPKVPEKNPIMRMEAQCRKLKDEKLAETVKVRINKTTLVRHLSHLSLMEINDCINVMDVPRELKDYFRVGDQWLKVNDSLLNGVTFAQRCVTMLDTPEIIITLKRIPFGTICDFPWPTNNIDEIGLILNGNEIERVYPEGLAHRRGSLQSNDTTSLHSAGLRCNYVITEVNFSPVNPNASTDEVWQMIKDTGRLVILILHPVDFRGRQRGYDMDGDDLYENVGC